MHAFGASVSIHVRNVTRRQFCGLFFAIYSLKDVIELIQLCYKTRSTLRES